MNAPDPNQAPDLDQLDPVSRWQFERTPETLNRAVRDLDPLIKQTLNNIGAPNDPYLYSQARVLAANALHSYDPGHGAEVRTWVSRQLMPLRRMRRESQSSIKIPDSVQLDSYKLHSAQREFEDEHDREPDLHELSERAGISVPRIKKVRKQFLQMPADGAFTGGGDDEGVNQPDHSEPDYTTEAADYVYHEADYADRKILEHLLGYANSEPLDGVRLAAMLKIHPSQVSRRAAKLRLRINEYTRILEGR